MTAAVARAKEGKLLGLLDVLTASAAGAVGRHSDVAMAADGCRRPVRCVGWL